MCQGQIGKCPSETWEIRHFPVFPYFSSYPSLKLGTATPTKILEFSKTMAIISQSFDDRIIIKTVVMTGI